MKDAANISQVVPVVSVTFIESPLFEIVTEDGPGSDWTYMIVATLENGEEATHCAWHFGRDKPKAEAFAQHVERAGQINLQHWMPGTPWDQYKTPQTYEEEKREALEKEAMGW